MSDPARIAHACRGNDHLGLRVLIDSPGFLGGDGEIKSRKFYRVYSLVDKFKRLLVIAICLIFLKS